MQLIPMDFIFLQNRFIDGESCLNSGISMWQNTPFNNLPIHQDNWIAILQVIYSFSCKIEFFNCATKSLFLMSWICWFSALFVATLIIDFFSISISNSDANRVSSVVCFIDTICVTNNAERYANLKASNERSRIVSISFINDFLAILWNWRMLV